MAHTKSARKRLKTSAEKHLRNRIRKTMVKNTETKYLDLVSKKDKEAASAVLNDCFKALDKAAKSGTIHKNKADRKKSRLAAKLTAMA